MALIFNISKYIAVPIVFEWLGVVEIIYLDSAISSQQYRPIFLNWLQEYSKMVNQMGILNTRFIHVQTLNALMWSVTRTKRKIVDEQIFVDKASINYLLRYGLDPKKSAVVCNLKRVQFYSFGHMSFQDYDKCNLDLFLNDKKIVQIIQCGYDFYFQLTKLNFNTLSIVKLIISLKILYCGSHVNELISRCSNLKTLSVDVEEQCIGSGIVITAVAYCIYLEVLHVMSDFPISKQALYLLVANKPRNLKSIHVPVVREDGSRAAQILSPLNLRK